MKINELKSFLRATVQSPLHVPIMIWSGPGIGKSAVVHQIADELKMDFIDLRLTLLNPVDLRGLPMINREKMRAQWLFPDFLPNGNNKDRGILFLDEINLAPAAVMAAGYQLILDRKLGDYMLPEGWKVIAAGNRVEDRANVTKFPAPLANRFTHITLDPDVEVWRNWAIQKGIREEIISFLGKFPQHLYQAPKAGDKAFPTPRSWELASRLMSLGQKIEFAIGEGVAAEFKAFLSVYQKLPDIDAVLTGKERNVPRNIDVLWALSTALVVRAEEKHIPVLMDYIKKMPKEFEVLTIINLSNRSDKMEAALINSPSWKQWIKDNNEIIEEKIPEDSDEYQWMVGRGANQVVYSNGTNYQYGGAAQI